MALVRYRKPLEKLSGWTALGVVLASFVTVNQALAEADYSYDPNNYLQQLKAQLHNTENKWLSHSSDDDMLTAGQIACSYKNQGYTMDAFSSYMLQRLSGNLDPNTANSESMRLLNTHINDYYRLAY